ncbi:MAG TPA: aldehyde dehydrogenase family protein, partial [Candidatus Lokiarchaeia archaeon]
MDTTIAKVPKSLKGEVDDTVAVAKEAFRNWANVPGIQRIQPLMKLETLLRENIAALTELTVKNHGKEWSAAEGEVVRAYQMIDAALAIPEMQKGEFMEEIVSGIDEYSVRVPLGVFA